MTVERERQYGRPMSHSQAEIESQPEIWAQVAEVAPSLIGKLPKKGEKVAVVGCGSSWFMSQCYAALREGAGHGETDAYVGSEFNYNRKYDRIVTISRSGTTTEIIDFAKQNKIPSVLITAIKNSPIAEHTSDEIVMEFADEQSVLQTRWATAALGLLRTHLGFNLRSIIDDAKRAMQEEISDLVDTEQISFLGRGWCYGLAQEAALKTRESSQFWAESYPALDYRHGPLSISQPGRAVWAFGEIPDDLARDCKATGAIFESSKLDPMAHLIKAQRVAVAKAVKKGVDPDNPRGLARSIILQ